MVGVERTTGTPGFGANGHVNTFLNSPEVLTLEIVSYTEKLGKGSTISDCNNSQTDFWEQTVIRVQMPSSSGDFSVLDYRRKLQLILWASDLQHSICCAGTQSAAFYHRYPDIIRGWSWKWHDSLMGLSSSVFLIWDWVPGRSVLLSTMCCIDPP